MKAFEILCGAGRLRPEVVLVAGVGSVLGMLVVPLPSSVLDVLLATHLAAAVLILVAVLVSGAPLAVSSFPTLLLFTTLFRLALNVSTTRLILSEGAAGEVVLAFGHFVARGDVVTGLVVFLILTLVQLMVIGKGAERVAEVGARFTLDALPGKQMSIDAALRSGAVTESEAEDRRRELARESQFYGAMDGAMKFVKGDATLSLLVTALNLVVGLGMGVWRLGLDLETAAETFALLTIGDGLVSQLPSLLIALASGVVTTRVRSGLEPDETLGRTMQAELFGRPQVLALTALLAGAVGVVPGLPTLPFVLIASLLAGAAVVVSRGGLGTPSGAPSSSDAPPAATGPPREAPKAAAATLSPLVLPMVVEVGPVLARKMGFGEGRDGETRLLSELIPQAREHVVMTIGVRMPPVKLRTVPSHPEGQVLFKVNEVAVATEELPVDHTLALAGPSELRRFGVTGRPTANPLNGRPAAWVSDAVAPLVESAGVSVWATDAALSLHLVRVTLEYAERFVGLQEVAEMVRSLEGCAPDLVAQVIPRTVTLSQTRDVLRQLVREGVSVRDLKTIVDALGTHGGTSANFIELVERVRAELGLQIVAAWAGPSRRVSAVTVDPVLEDLVRDAVVERPSGSSLALAPEHRRAIIEAAQRVLEPVMGAGAAPIIVTHAPVRYFFQELVAGELPARVLSYEELPRDIHVLPVGCVAFEAVERLVAA